MICPNCDKEVVADIEQCPHCGCQFPMSARKKRELERLEREKKEREERERQEQKRQEQLRKEQERQDELKRKAP